MLLLVGLRVLLFCCFVRVLSYCFVVWFCGVNVLLRCCFVVLLLCGCVVLL